MRWHRIIIFFVWTLAGSLSAHAQSANSVQNGAWDNPNTWDCACIPNAAGTTVTISHAVTFSSSTGTISIFTVSINNSPATNNASLTMSGGILNVSDGALINGYPNNFTADLTLNGNAVMNVSGGALIVTSEQQGDLSSRISLSGTSNLNSNVYYNYQPTDAVAEAQTEISITSSAVLTGDIQAVYNSSTKNSQLFILVNGSATVNGDISLINTEGGSSSNPVLLRAGVTSGSPSCTACKINAGTITLENDDTSAPSNNRVLLEARNSSVIKITGDLNLISLPTTAATGYNRLKTFNSAYVSVGGDVFFSRASGSTNDNRIDIAFSGTGSSILEMKGNTINPGQGTYSYGSGSTATAVFSGSIAQVIPTAQPNYIRLRINNSSGQNLTLVSGATVSDSLNMINGVLNTVNTTNVGSSYKNLLLSATCVSNGGNSNSFVINGLTKIGSGAVTLPLGANGHWAPMKMSNIVGASDFFTAFNCNYYNASPSSTTTDGTFDHVSGREYWNASIYDNSSGTPGLSPPTSLDMTFYWKDACQSRINNVSTSPQDLYISRFNTGTNVWNLINPSNINGTSQACIAGGAAETGDITVNVSGGVSAYTQFTFGAGSPFGNSLPITLVDFQAYLKSNSSVQLEWKTLSELNSDHFLIERSSDGIDFTFIGKVQGHGTTSETHAYNFSDTHALSAKNYYRLKQIDFDGRFTFSPVRMVNAASDVESSWMYPNPVAVSETVFFTERVSVQVMDYLGQVVSSANDTDRFNTAGLAPGIHLLLNLKNGQVVKLAVK